MTGASYRVFPEGYGSDVESKAGEDYLAWPVYPGKTETVRSDLAWDLAPLSGATPVAGDLLHIAAGAYMADRSTPRGLRFSRDIALQVVVHAPEVWTSDIVVQVERLLGWLTGDTWTVTVTAGQGMNVPDVLDGVTADRPVSLLSGGLDSFLGAIELCEEGEQPIFVGHKDLATSILAAQERVYAWIARSYAPPSPYTRIALTQTRKRRESSSRSRSLLFLSLGVAVAVSNRSTTLVVPENGYTGINLPLRPNRGGALSTRSTHPETFRRVNELLETLDIEVTVTNPFEWLTKGEAMSLVAAREPGNGWVDTAAQTVSCGKLGGNWFSGSPNLNCGLCVPCILRRATFLAANVPDQTDYLCHTLTGTNLDDLVGARRGDIEAVRYAVEAGVDPHAIDAGTWPLDYDLDRAEQLVQKGLDELRLVDLPRATSTARLKT